MNNLLVVLAAGALVTMNTGCSRAVEGVKQESSALRFKVKTLQGEEVDLAKYEGKVVMIVNVASKCGYTPQYKQLQQLHEKYCGTRFGGSWFSLQSVPLARTGV